MPAAVSSTVTAASVAVTVTVAFRSPLHERPKSSAPGTSPEGRYVSWAVTRRLEAATQEGRFGQAGIPGVPALSNSLSRCTALTTARHLQHNGRTSIDGLQVVLK